MLLYAHALHRDEGTIVLFEASADEDFEGPAQLVAVDHRAAQVILDELNTTREGVPIEVEEWQILRGIGA